MLCNAVHFFDLYLFLADRLPVSRSFSEKNYLIKAKRLGFDELVGSIRLYDQNGSELVLHDTGGQSSRVILLESGHQRYLIHEEDAVMLKVDTQLHQCETVAIGFEKTSVQMTRIFKSIICQNHCELPTFLEAMQSHDHLMHIKGDFS